MRVTNVYAGLCCLLAAACADGGVDPETHASEPSDPSREEATEQTEPLIAAPASDDAASLYAVDPKSGRVARAIPPAVLADVLAQLEHRGLKRELAQLKSLYDIHSGRVRDPSDATRAEQRIRARRAEIERQP